METINYIVTPVSLGHAYDALACSPGSMCLTMFVMLIVRHHDGDYYYYYVTIIMITIDACHGDYFMVFRL